MEGAGDESFSRYAPVPETANGDFRLAAHVVGVLFHGVFLSSRFGCYPTHVVVGGASVGYVANLPHTRQVDGRTADSSGSHCHYECGYRLLGLLSEVTRPFLCCCNRHHVGRGLRMAIPSGTR